MKESTIQWEHSHDFGVDSAQNKSKVKIVFWLTTIIMVLEIAAGTWSGSMALFADGWHMGTHSAAFLIAIFAYSSLRRGKQAHNKSLRKIGAQYGVGDSEVSLRWAMQQGISVIPRTSNEKHLRLNIVASQFNLSSNDMKTICKLQESEKNCRYCSGFAEVD